MRRSILLKYIFISTVTLFILVSMSFYALLKYTRARLEKRLRKELLRTEDFVEANLKHKLFYMKRVQKRFFNLAVLGLFEDLKGDFLWNDSLVKVYFREKDKILELEKVKIPKEKLPSSGCTVGLEKGRFILSCGSMNPTQGLEFGICWDIVSIFRDILMTSSVHRLYIVVSDREGRILFSNKISEISSNFRPEVLKDYIVHVASTRVPLLGSINIYTAKSRKIFYADLKNWERVYILTLFACLLTIALLTLLFRRRIASQVMPIVEAIEGLSQEDYTVRVKNVDKLKGEFRYIAEVLNRMGDRILDHYRRAARYLEIFRNLNESVILTDPKGVITYANRPTQHLLGYDRKELVGISIYNLYKNGLPIRLESISKEPTVLESVELVRKDGQTVMCRQTISPVREEDRVTGYVFLTVDLTEKIKLLKELEEKTRELEAKNEELRSLNDELQIQAEELEANSEELRVLNEELEEKNRELEKALEELQRISEEKEKLYKQLIRDEKMRVLGLMASGLAHNFNNILTVILGNVELLEAVVKDENIKKRLEKIKKAAEDGIDTIKRLSDFAKFREKPIKELVDIREIIDDAFELTRPIWVNRVKKKGVEIEVEKDYCQEPALVIGNPGELKEMFVNLITNAVDAMPYGGKIRVMVAKEKDYILIDFTDTGVGIPKEIKDKIFDPFFTTKSTHGTGLGLSMVYWTVENHGGTIEVYSEEGHGTTFSIRLLAASREDV